MIAYRSNAAPANQSVQEPPEPQTDSEGRPTIAAIRAAVCAHYGLPAIAMVAERRSVQWARPRQVAMHLAQELTPCSLPVIGRHFGGRDHTTVMHACRRIETLRGGDMCLDADVRALTRLLAQAHIPTGLAIAGHEADLARVQG